MLFKFPHVSHFISFYKRRRKSTILPILEEPEDELDGEFEDGRNIGSNRYSLAVPYARDVRSSSTSSARKISTGRNVED